MSRKARHKTTARPASRSYPTAPAAPIKGVTFFRWGWTSLIVGATVIPYLLNWLSTPAGYHYTWILPPYPEDSLGYRAWAQQAAHGAWLFQIKYTALPHQAFLFHPFFLVCGWLSALFSCDLGLIFLILKTIGVVLFFITFYRYLDYLGLSPLSSIAASVFLGASSGFGGLFAFLDWLTHDPARPADLWMPEMTTYSSLLWNPLFPLSLLLMLLAISWLDRGTRHRVRSRIWWSGLATGFMTLIHPYSAPLLLALAVVITVAREGTKAGGDLCRYFAGALPFVLYVALIAKLNPLAAQHSALGEMKSPPLTAYLLGFGLPLLIAVAGLAFAWPKIRKQDRQLMLWFLFALTFAYLPFWFQRKLVFGAHIPLSVLAGLALQAIWVRCSATSSWKWIGVTAAIILLPVVAGTPIYLLARERTEVAENKNSTYYLSDDVMSAMAFLKQNSNPHDVVFSSLATSRLIPAFSGNTVVWGHWAMSIDLKERQTWVANIFDPKSPWDDERKSREFWGTDLQFVFIDETVRQWMQSQPSLASLILKDSAKVFENPSVMIYQRPANLVPSR